MMKYGKKFVNSIIGVFSQVFSIYTLKKTYFSYIKSMKNRKIYTIEVLDVKSIFFIFLFILLQQIPNKICIYNKPSKARAN